MSKKIIPFPGADNDVAKRVAAKLGYIADCLNRHGSIRAADYEMRRVEILEIAAHGPSARVLNILAEIERGIDDNLAEVSTYRQAGDPPGDDDTQFIWRDGHLEFLP
jgi:hypothetical protein